MIFKKFYNHNIEDVEFFAKKFDIEKKVMETVLNRGINTEQEIEDYLNPTKFHDPLLLKGMKELKERLFIAKELKDRVLIFGDYDVDGVSATAIMLETLKELGIVADYYLPNRYKDGYGLTCEIIDKLIDKFDPQLIITVDCGISCFNEVEYAKSKGVEIIVTDHHEIPDVIPDTIVLNAKIKGQDYPFSELCGAGLAFKISQTLIGEKAEKLLPICAVATIADIVPLKDENRVIVKRGLELFEKYLPLGLKLLIKENKLKINTINSTDISFKIAPKINASGRMGDAADSLKLYLAKDESEAKKYIDKIKKHNTKRQALCNQIQNDCEKALKKMDLRNLRVIVLASKKWDQGVLGIICSRLVEKYHRPVFLFSQVDDCLHGSGRSIDDINIHQVLNSVSDILETFGGHSMAAGLTIKRTHYEEFSKRINAFVLEKVDDEVFIPISYYDLDINEDDLTEKFLQDMKKMEPFGCKNANIRFKITTNNVKVEKMKRFNEHANVKIGDISLVFFNFLKYENKIRFSKDKSFIFELHSNEKKGVVEYFDGGNFIVHDANKFVDAVELEQLKYEKGKMVNYNLFTQKQLLQIITSTKASVFGTAFVAFSASDFISFLKKYDTKNLFDFGIVSNECFGYNSLLLSPVGVDWAKNFSKIVFLSPVLDEGYLESIKNISGAEVFLPANLKFDAGKFKNINLSREYFATVFSFLQSIEGKKFISIFELFEGFLTNEKFASFFVAYSVFEELGIIRNLESDIISIKVNKSVKRELTESSFYNKLCLIKNLTNFKD